MSNTDPGYDLLVVGQSHAAALHRGTALLTRSMPLRARFIIFQSGRVRLIREGDDSTVEGDWGSKSVFQTVRQEAAQARQVAIMWAGSQFNVRALFVRDQDFDVTVGEAPTLRGAHLLPVSSLEWLIRETLSGAMSNGVDLARFCAELRQQCPAGVAFLAPPPPSPDAAVLAGFRKEPLLVEVVTKISAGGAERLVEASVRAKLWRILCRVYAEYAARAGLEFISPPEGTVAHDGLLLPEFASGDATHANAKYGALYLNKILKSFGSALFE